MQMINRTLHVLIFSLCLLLLYIPKLHAAPPSCDAAAEGTIAYNTDHKLVQFCNGTQWIGLTAKIGGAGDTLSDLSCTSGQVPEWNGSAWICGASGGSSVWLDGGAGKIYYNDGNVGIGTNDPTYRLSVALSATSRVDIRGDALEIARDETDSPQTGGFIDLKKSLSDDTRVRLAYQDNLGDGTGKGFLVITDSDGGTYSGAGRLAILDTGLVGIGTSYPKTRLDIAGTLRIGNDSELCNAAAHEGAMRYVAATDKFQMCRSSGTGWEDIGAGSGSGGITSLTGDVTASGSGSVAATIANNAVTSAKIADGTVTNADLAGSIALSKLAVTGTANSSVFLRGDGSWQAVPSSADNLGNHTATTDLLMGGNQVDFSEATGDKALWYSNTYGTGIESSTLTNWSAGNHRWRVGGTSASTGTEKMLLSSTGLDVTGTVTSSGEIISTNANQARFVSGNYGVIHRNDGTNYYMLLTASGDQYGTWNTLRPFRIENATGNVYLANSAVSITHAGVISGNGSGLTALNASSLASGTVPAARLPAYTGDVTKAAGGTALSIAAGVVGSTEIADGGIATADLANAAVTAAKTSFVGTLTEGKWCTVSGGKIVCTSDAPSGGGGGGGSAAYLGVTASVDRNSDSAAQVDAACVAAFGTGARAAYVNDLMPVIHKTTIAANGRVRAAHISSMRTGDDDDHDDYVVHYSLFAEGLLYGQLEDPNNHATCLGSGSNGSTGWVKYGPMISSAKQLWSLGCTTSSAWHCVRD